MKTTFGTKTVRPLSVNKLGDMIKIISVGADLSQIYANHHSMKKEIYEKLKLA